MTTRNMVTTTRLGHPVNKYYMTKFLDRRMPKMLYTMFGTPYSLPAGVGDTILWDRFTNPTAQTTPLVEGEDPRPILQSRAQVEARVREYGAYMKCSSWMDVTAPNSYARQRTTWLSDQHSLTIDTLCRNTIIGTASSATCANGTPTATMINRTDIETLTEALLGNEARQITSAINAGTGQGTSPATEGFVMIAHTNLRIDFYNATGFLKDVQYGSKAAGYPGLIGMLGDCHVCLTTNGYVSGGTYSNLIISEDCYGNIRLPADDNLLIHLTPREVGSPLLSYSTYGWKCTYAAKITNDNWLRVLNCTRGSRS